MAQGKLCGCQYDVVGRAEIHTWQCRGTENVLHVEFCLYPGLLKQSLPGAYIRDSVPILTEEHSTKTMLSWP